LLGAPRHFKREGINHAANLGTPLAGFFVPLSGVMAIAGALSVILGLHAKIGAWLLIAFLIPVTFRMHGFWKIKEPVALHVQQVNFVKNLSLIGAALLIAYSGIGPISFDGH